jgi:hypothetical protein
LTDQNLIIKGLEFKGLLACNLRGVFGQKSLLIIGENKMSLHDTLLWRSFLALEKNLLDTFYYVELSEKNNDVFSLAYRSIILQSCSDIESLLKTILGYSQDEKLSMDTYRQDSISKELGFEKVLVQIPLNNAALTPWEKWGTNKSPEFWHAYIEIKHQGHISKATLKNAIEALAGLFVLLIKYYSKNIEKLSYVLFPKFFSHSSLPNFVTGRLVPIP